MRTQKQLRDSIHTQGKKRSISPSYIGSYTKQPNFLDHDSSAAHTSNTPSISILIGTL